MKPQAARYPTTTSPLESVRGELMTFTVHGSNFWGVGKLRTTDGDTLLFTANLPNPSIGATLKFTGSYVEHARYGRQFKVHQTDIVSPTDDAGVIAWLADKLPQISRNRALDLVTRHGAEGVWRLLETGDVEQLMKTPGITHERANEILIAYAQHESDRARQVRFREWGLTDKGIARVTERWGADAEARLLEDPYLLITEVDGFGWERADAIALRMGYGRETTPRLRAGIEHALREAKTMGHVFVPEDKLVQVVAKKVCNVDAHLVARALAGADRVLIEGGRVYLPPLAHAEALLAEGLRLRVTHG